MRLSTLPRIRIQAVEQRNLERSIFQVILENLENKSICDLFLDGEPNKNHFQMKWDGVLFVVLNIRTMHIHFIYGPDGIHEPTFCRWDNTKKRTRYPKFKFWESEKFKALVPAEPLLAENSVIAFFHRNALESIMQRVSVRDLLYGCRLVNKHWSRVAQSDSVWNHRLSHPGPQAFERFLKEYCLVDNLSWFVKVDPQALGRIGQAWVRYFKFPDTDIRVITRNVSVKKGPNEHLHIVTKRHEIRAEHACTIHGEDDVVAWLSFKGKFNLVFPSGAKVNKTMLKEFVQTIMLG